MICRLVVTDSKRDWIAPRSARAVLTAVNAASMAARAVLAPATLEISRVVKPVVVAAEVVAAVRPVVAVVAVPANPTVISLVEVRVIVVAVSLVA